LNPSKPPFGMLWMADKVSGGEMTGKLLARHGGRIARYWGPVD
jgi:hypothetical protein